MRRRRCGYYILYLFVFYVNENKLLGIDLMHRRSDQG